MGSEWTTPGSLAKIRTASVNRGWYRSGGSVCKCGVFSDCLFCGFRFLRWLPVPAMASGSCDGFRFDFFAYNGRNSDFIEIAYMCLALFVQKYTQRTLSVKSAENPLTPPKPSDIIRIAIEVDTPFSGIQSVNRPESLI